MPKTKIFIFIVCISFLSGCTVLNAVFHKTATDDEENNSIPVYRTGIGDNDIVNANMTIDRFDSVSSAKEAGMQIGDLIVTVNGKKLSNNDFLKLMHYNRGEDVFFTINRNGQMIDYNVTPKVRWTVSPTNIKICERLFIDKRQVSIAVIIAGVKNSYAGDFRSWEESVQQTLQGHIENYLLEAYGRYNSFSIVDRSRIDKILEEYKMNMSGLMADDTRARIGNMTGATHLLIATFSRHPKGQSCVDITNRRLIELESGKVLAIDQKQVACK